MRNRCASAGTALPQEPESARKESAKEIRVIAFNKVTVRCQAVRCDRRGQKCRRRWHVRWRVHRCWRCEDVDRSSHHGVVPPTHSRFSFVAPSHVPDFAPKLPVATPHASQRDGHRRRTKGKRTTLRKHIFSSFLLLLHPPVHLRQLSAWQASRAWKNSLQTTGTRVRDEGVGRTEGGHTEPVGLLGVHAW